ncbi:pentatricopeptide repeat-containing protein At4g02750-like [Macadamia integrifolia]|uniref:pentatricopeptide repeat-containing protein At4g02750-like n=1 Tax=Macadamia integrifolia TaxID=60698 RepID=UPI001C52BF06|nr:pentatricopeptide repeat-containing protein At4g02750-like [Macadamia integrifolia]
MSARNILIPSTTCLNQIINRCIRTGLLDDARKLFDQNPEYHDIVSWNSMIAGCVKHDRLRYAKELFDRMPQRDTVTWNSMLLGFQRTHDSENAVRYFVEMGRIGEKPNEFTLSTIISTITNTDSKCLILQLHTCVVCLAFNSSVYVGSALMGGYASLGCKISLRRAFEDISVKNVISWNAMISGYMSLGFVAEARSAFNLMPDRNVVSWTTLVKGYISNKMLEEARFMFDRMTERNVVSWTVMISGYEQYGLFVEALEVFLSMWRSGGRPNHYTFSSVISACAGCSALLIGKQVHLSIFKLGLLVDVILSSSLVDMYAKCGDITAAAYAFESMLDKNVVSWNSIIGGYARHGLGTRALEEFERMLNNGVEPDYVTFVNVLSACSHGGLVEEGEKHFASMDTKYGIKAGLEHYACMVDLFGRAGQLDKAEKMIKGMPMEPDVIVWGALLGACGLHSSLELGMFAADRLYQLEKDHPAVYSVLYKIHGEREVWSNVTGLRKMMKEMHVKKQNAGSWLESQLT